MGVSSNRKGSQTVPKKLYWCCTLTEAHFFVSFPLSHQLLFCIDDVSTTRITKTQKECVYSKFVIFLAEKHWKRNIIKTMRVFQPQKSFLPLVGEGEFSRKGRNFWLPYTPKFKTVCGISLIQKHQIAFVLEWWSVMRSSFSPWEGGLSSPPERRRIFVAPQMKLLFVAKKRRILPVKCSVTDLNFSVICSLNMWRFSEYPTENKFVFEVYQISDWFTEESESSLIFMLRDKKICSSEHFTEQNDSSVILSVEKIHFYVSEHFTEKIETSVNLVNYRIFCWSLMTSMKIQCCSHLVNVHWFRWTLTQHMTQYVVVG